MEEMISCPVCSSVELLPFLECKDHFLTAETFSIQQCQSCGLKFTNPRPETGELGKYYKSNEYISHTNSTAGVFNKVYQLVRKFTLLRKFKLLNHTVRSGKRVIDIGCATGEFLAMMKEKGWTVTGIEPDAQAREMAKLQHGLEVFDENGLSQMQKQSFDAVTMWHVLEHVSNLHQRISEIDRLLVAGGTLIIAVPNPDCPDAKHYGSFWAGYDVPRHLYHFTPESIKTLISKYSFSVEKILPMKFDSFYVSLLSEKYLHGKMKWSRGIWIGLISNWAARRENNYSSLIYILRKG